MPTSVNNQRIAKNTILLYGRMLLIMAVSLYTSRVVLNTLGVEDYGIYNVVGGIVTMFSFLNGSMVTSTQRYITFELGRGDSNKLRVLFNTSVQIHALLSILIIILCETVGLWFFYNKMVVPEGRMTAAFWVYQFSIITMVIQVMSAPYNALIIAHEEMNVFALISIIDTVLRLAIVYFLRIWSIDKLVLYAILVGVVQLFIRFLYTAYCKKKYPESQFLLQLDKSLIAEMGGFAGWNLIGNLAVTLYGTGLNLLLNMFFGPIVNAARAIAVQVESAVAMFSTNFLMAVNPQITKQYAQGNLVGMHTLLFRASKFTCFLLVILSLPLLLETRTILNVWLKTVPDYTVSFLRIILLIAIIDSTARPLMTAVSATGIVRNYQLIIGGILITILPVAYFALRFGCNPTSVFIVHLIICIIAFIARLLIVRPLISLSLRDYFFAVILRCLIVSVGSFILALFIKRALPSGFVFSCANCLISIITASILALCFGCSSTERSFLIAKVKSIFITLNREKE